MTDDNIAQQQRMTVKMKDIVDFDGGGKHSGLFQGLAVQGEGLGQEESSLIFAVKLEMNDGFVGV